jgi:hypothetical protein
MIIVNIIEDWFVPGCRSDASSVRFRLEAMTFKGDPESPFLNNLLSNYQATIRTESSKLKEIV